MFVACYDDLLLLCSGSSIRADHAGSLKFHETKKWFFSRDEEIRISIEFFKHWEYRFVGRVGIDFHVFGRLKSHVQLSCDSGTICHDLDAAGNSFERDCIPEI